VERELEILQQEVTALEEEVLEVIAIHTILRLQGQIVLQRQVFQFQREQYIL
jgi:hypothetical protein